LSSWKTQIGFSTTAWKSWEKKGLLLGAMSTIFFRNEPATDNRTEFGQNASHLSAAGTIFEQNQHNILVLKVSDFPIYLSNSVSRATHIVASSKFGQLPPR
jgi:hypothetical protein